MPFENINRHSDLGLLQSSDGKQAGNIEQVVHFQQLNSSSMNEIIATKNKIFYSKKMVKTNKVQKGPY